MALASQGFKVRVVAFRPEHVRALELQDAQRFFSGAASGVEYGQALAQSGSAFTALDGDRVIACSGCVEIWDNRAMAWALISKDAGRHMVGIHKAVAGYLSAAKYKRIEAWVDEGFEPGMRWLELLGFTRETPLPMRGVRPDGGSCFLFSKVK